MTDGSVASLGSIARAFPNLERIIRGLLLVYVFALPFKGLLVIERTGFLILLCLLGVWCAVHRDHFFRRTPIDIPLAAFVLWVGLTIPSATDPGYSLQEYGKLLKQPLIFYVMLFFFQDRVHRAQLIWPLMGGLFLVSANGIIRFDETMRGGGSFLTAEVWLTTYLIMLIPLGFALAWHEGPGWTRNAWILATVAATGCLFLTESRAGLLTFIVELWACAWLLRTRAMLIAAGAFTAAAVAGVVLLVMVMATPDGADKISASPVPLKTATTSFVHRIDIAKFTFARIAEYPVLGIGYGKETYKKLFGDVPENDLPPGHAPVRIYGTHNILLETALHVGLPGLALFVWLAGRMGRTLIEGYRRAVGAHARAFLLGTGVALIGLGVRLQFDQLLVGSLAVQFWVLLAAATAACDRPAGEVSSLKPLFRRRCNAA